MALGNLKLEDDFNLILKISMKFFKIPLFHYQSIVG